MERLTLERSESHFMGLSVQQELTPLFSESDSEGLVGTHAPSSRAAAADVAPRRALSLVQRLAVVDSRERHYWLLLQLIGIAVIVFIWPLELAFRSIWAGEGFIAFVVLDYVCDAIFVADMILGFVCAKDKAKHVRSVWFWIDVLAVVPADLFVWNPLWLHFVLRANRVLRLARAREYAFEFERFSVKGRLILVIKLALSLLFISNAFSCSYVALSFLEGFSTPWGVSASYAAAPLVELYFQGFAWSWQVISRCGGSFAGPITVAEKGLTVCLGLIVLFLGAVVIGEISGVITTSQLKQVKLTAKLRAVSEFASSHNLPQSMSEKLVLEVNNHWNASQHEDFAAVLRDSCSQDMQGAVAVFLHKDVLRRVPLFASLSHECIKSLAVGLKSRWYQPSEFVVREGETGSTMFFVDSGTLEVLRNAVELGGALAVYSGAKTGKDRIGILNAGDFIGEATILDASAERSASVRALTVAHVFELTGKTLRHVLKRYPAQMAAIELIAHERSAQSQLRSLFHGFAEGVLPLFRLERRERGDVLLSCGQEPPRLFLLVKGRLAIADTGNSVVAEVSESMFCGSHSRPTDYSVVVASDVAFVFVLSQQVAREDVDMVLRHEKFSVAWFAEHARGQREREAASAAKGLGKKATAAQAEALGKNGFGAKLLEMLGESGQREMKALTREQLALAVTATNKLTKALLKTMA
jgi:CRP-like cAMP-binding protein